MKTGEQTVCLVALLMLPIERAATPMRHRDSAHKVFTDDEHYANHTVFA